MPVTLVYYPKLNQWIQWNGDDNEAVGLSMSAGIIFRPRETDPQDSFTNKVDAEQIFGEFWYGGREGPVGQSDDYFSLCLRRDTGEDDDYIDMISAISSVIVTGWESGESSESLLIPKRLAVRASSAVTVAVRAFKNFILGYADADAYSSDTGVTISADELKGVFRAKPDKVESVKYKISHSTIAENILLDALTHEYTEIGRSKVRGARDVGN